MWKMERKSWSNVEAAQDTKIKFQNGKKRTAIGWTTKKNKIIPQISYYFCSSGTSDKTQIKGKWKMEVKVKKRITKNNQNQSETVESKRTVDSEYNVGLEMKKIF